MFSSIILIQSSKQDFSQHSSHSSVSLASLLRARVCHVVGLKHWWQSKKVLSPTGGGVRVLLKVLNEDNLI